jgi:hypothetical protein
MEAVEKLKLFFEKHEDKFLEFDLITNKLSSRPDLHAFLLLDKIVPRNRDMISGAEHDKIWLDIEPSELVDAITEEQVVELVRCGVMCDNESLMMFV